MSNRGKAARLDVRVRVNYAFCSGDHTNPYAGADRRFALFEKELKRTQAIDADFRDINEVYGGNPDDLVLRQYPHPGPIIPYEELRYTPVRRFPGDRHR
jgi:hypothetical protein